ncbi:MAG: LemA family protein [Bacilli bacterium]|jgi:LemA protein
MDNITFTISLLIVGSIFGLIYVAYYNKFQKYLIKIKTVENKVDETLRDRFDLLSNAAAFVKENIKEDVMHELSELEKNDLSSFDLDRRLIPITREFYNLKATHRELDKMGAFTNIDFALKENEAQLDGYVSYYNDNIAQFNRLIRIFPSNIIARISNFKEKTFYDGKNMNDKNVDDFKL